MDTPPALAFPNQSGWRAGNQDKSAKLFQISSSSYIIDRYLVELKRIAGSSNGRTTDSESVYLGPTPSPTAFFMRTCVLMLTCANKKEADKITKSLLEKRLIVCSKAFPVSSSFLWKGKINSSDEILLLMDSIEENFETINREIRKLHSYETFVLTSLAVNQTTKEVENWAKEELK